MVSLRRLDWILNGAVFFLAGAGLLMLFTIERELFWLQVAWVVIGFAGIIACVSIDWRPFVNYRWMTRGLYVVAVVLLIITYFVAPVIRNVRGWIVIGPLNFQVAEFVKLAILFLFSAFFAKRHISIGHPKNLLISFIYAVIPAGLIAIQPDFGSAIIIIGIWFGYILVSGIQWKHLLLIMSIAIFGFGALWMSPFFAEYQKERVLNLLNPDRDPLGYGYNVIQSKIAIGSAGIWGKGFGQGTQAQLGFLPEAHSDFIFAAFIEEWGLVGGILVICAFLLILFQIMRIGLRADDNFTKLFCLGTSIVLLLHFILNVGSTIGLVPVVGVSFPFLSHGGSNFLLNAVLIGFIQSMRTHRYV